MGMGMSGPQGVFPRDPSAGAALLDLASNLQRDFGASGSAQTTTGTIAANSSTLALATALDFETGQGVFLPNAGALSTLATPDAPGISIGGGPSGSSTYSYAIVALDGLGGGSAASATGTITTGAAVLSGLGPDGSGEDQILGSATWLQIEVTGVTGATGYAIYRTAVPATSGLATGYLGLYSYLNTPFLDYGQAIQTPPPGVPPTPPTAAFGQSLVTTITAGGGTTLLTLRDAAATAVTDSPVYHDDSIPIINFLADANPNKYIPPGSYGLSQTVILQQTGVRLFGSGSASLFRYQSNANAGLAVLASHTCIEDLAVDGQTQANCLSIGSASSVLQNIHVRGCYFSRPSFYGVLVNGDAWNQDLILTENCITDAEYAFEISGYWQDLIIANNRVTFTDYNRSGRGVSLHNGGGSSGAGYQRHWTIVGNLLKCGNHTAAIVVQGSGLGTITGNVCLVSGGIFGFATFGDNTAPEQSSGYVFADNYCEALWGGSGVGASLTNVIQVSIARNVFRNFGYAYELSYPGLPGYSDAVANNVRFADNQIAVTIAPWVGSIPLSAQFAQNAGQNPLGTITPPVTPLASGTVYQNMSGVAITIYQPAYATTPGTAGSVAVALGSTDTPSTLYTDLIDAGTTSSVPRTLTLRVPPGWWYSFTVTGATLANAQIQGE